jgi:HD-GYP domain-containing protein (c-di-GMP phosphodiesterase class II)
MADVLERLRQLRQDVEALGSLPLVPDDDFAHYAHTCGEMLALTEEIVARPDAVADPAQAAEQLFRLGLVVRRAGDAMTSAMVFEHAASFAKARGVHRRASSALNSLGITLYQIGDFERARAHLEEAIAIAGDDDFGLVRAAGIRMNWGNVLHYEKHYEEAEQVYLAISRDVEAMAPELFTEHSTYLQQEIQGILRVNLAGNRCNWAHAEASGGARIGSHTERAGAFLREAFAHPMKNYPRMTARCIAAQLLVLEGRPEEAGRQLVEIAQECGRDRELLPQLPQAYRYAAEASVALGDSAQAIVNCHRALESSLMVANDVEERTVVDTFVEVLKLSSQFLFAPTDSPAVRARRFVEGGSDLVDRLVDFLERKDWYKGHSHSRAVATLSLTLLRSLREIEGEEARFSENENLVKLAGTLHDIGKLALPWSLLNKILPLNDHERALIRTHPEQGDAILREIGLADVGAITLEHHETPAGTGYPSGARELSDLGAIVGVAEAYEAMTSVDRRDRTPRTHEGAVREVKAASGTQFEPRIVRALVSVFESRR